MSSPSPSPSSTPKNESPAQLQARLRRERRQAKIQAGGADRLAKITSLSGRPVEPAPPTTSVRTSTQPSATTSPSPPQTTSTAASPSVEDDPEEVDISQHYYQPRSNNATPPQSQISEDQLRQLMLGLDAQTGRASPQGNPFLGSGGRSPGMQQGPQQAGFGGLGGGAGEEEDPMMRMLQQMMGGAAGGGGGEGLGGLPPGLAEMMGAMGGGQGQSQPQPDRYGYLWRVVHAFFALALGAYISVTTTFSGSHFSRAESIDAEVGVRFFWVFATAELVLQSTRFFVERGKGPSSGILGGLGAMLPEPYAGYLRVVSRYSVIYTTLMADAMVVVFVLGSVAWWKGLAA